MTLACKSDRQKRQISTTALRVLLMFCTMKENNIIRKLTKLDFEIKILSARQG